jgi:hypothetical protein
MNTYYLNHLNWPAIAVAAVAYFMLGALWYSLLFKNAWIKSSGVKMDDPNAKKGVAGIFIITLALEFVACVGLAILAAKMSLRGGGVITGAKLGLLTGISFATVGITISYLYQMKPRILSIIDSFYHIVEI